MQFNVNLDKELVQKIDKRASELYISRSAYISMCLAKSLLQDEIMSKMPQMMSDFQQLAAFSALVEETEKEKKEEGEA